MAKKFQFRLQQVLNYRKQTEESRVRELAEAKGSLLRHEELMKAHEAEQTELIDQYRGMEESGSFKVEEAVFLGERQAQLLKRGQTDQKRAGALADFVEEKRKTVIAASKDRRLLENLKDRQQAQHAGEEARDEQKFLDEISSIAFTRRERADKAARGELNENLRR
jgi:flagellar FliJ protein